VGGRLASLLESGVIANCTDFEQDHGKPLARKPVYEGKADARVSWMGPPPHIATISLSALEDVTAKNKLEPEIISEDIPKIASHTRLLKQWKVGLSELDLAEAEVVIGVGKGVDAAFMGVIHKLAELVGGVIGGTRIAVHSGMIPHDRLIGTTGKWLNSKAYIALGISGAPQHVMGIKEVKETVAINVAKDAPIFNHAKTGVVGDLHEIVRSLIALIEAEVGTNT
jgi:electron transfer flavoprotein alpha subunit